jgi:hypothetical protein
MEVKLREGLNLLDNTTFNITTLSITTISTRSFYVTLSIKDSQHECHSTWQCFAIMLIVAFYLLLCRMLLC